MQKALSKGVPPLFVDLRSLYEDKSKASIIEELCLGYVESLKKCGKYNDKSTNGPKEPASALLWVYYYLAQHYDYFSDTETALKYIDAAIEHTPTLIELYVTKGRIHKVSSLLFELLFYNSAFFFFFLKMAIHRIFLQFIFEMFLTACWRSPRSIQVVGRGSTTRHGRSLHKFKVFQIYASSQQS